MPHHETTRRMAVVLEMHDKWFAFAGSADDPVHMAWLEEATMWTMGRRNGLPPHPHLRDAGESPAIRRFQCRPRVPRSHS